jgi:hypothetical protein
MPKNRAVTVAQLAKYKDYSQNFGIVVVAVGSSFRSYGTTCNLFF